MVLSDTSIWIDHLRQSNRRLVALLRENLASTHPWVIGELACGNLADRENILQLLRSLPGVPVATDEEVLFFIESRSLVGKGIGYIDMHLLAAAALGGLRLWTADKKLQTAAARLGVHA